MRQLELLAPAKSYEQGRDAILCGADAVYVGAPKFGARAAASVTQEDIARLCNLAHRYGARVYVAMNTLLWENELKEAEQMATAMYQAGADALILQDMAFLRMNLPPICLHASTQMFNTTARGAEFLSSVGFSRVVSERALSVEQIAAIAQTGIEVETFIHGAICVCLSGRCYMSRTTSNRSGNRGECSQSCRLPYNLLDGDMRPLMRDKHLLSLQDLNLTDHLKELIDAGVSSFKIEGRLKDSAYVRNTVSWYRQKIDEIISSRSDLSRSSFGDSEVDFESNPSKTFSRGATAYYINGSCGGVASIDSPKSKGEYVGRVVRVSRDSFEVSGAEGVGLSVKGSGLGVWSSAAVAGISAAQAHLSTGRISEGAGLGAGLGKAETGLDAALAQLAAGDGVCFTNAMGQLTGTNINRVEGRTVWPNHMDDIAVGVDIYRNFDRQFIHSVEGSRPTRRIPLEAQVEIRPTEVHLVLRQADVVVKAVAEGVFDKAKNAERARENIIAQITKMGDTSYRVAHIEIVSSVEGSDEVRFVPISMLNELRRATIEKLDNRISELHRRPDRGAEDLASQFPATSLTGEANVTNSLSEKFYRDHGVVSVERGLDLAPSLKDKRVMQMKYCIRRELGQCLVDDNPQHKGSMYIENGLHQYELQFDCADCRMDVIYRGLRERIKQ